MSDFTFRVAGLVAGAVTGASLLVAGVPAASAAPATDAQGFVDSTARCPAADTAVAYGSTAASRVAICKSTSGQYEYRGVRISDGAKLILAATADGRGGYAATSGGITYTVSAKALDISAGSQSIRSEPMTFFRSGGPVTGAAPSTAAPAAPTAAPLGTPATPVTGAPEPAPTTPLPPPLAAEVGGARPSGH
ncbi:hypothetical protein FZI85_12025 [Mycobacterium sp. CBMA293]|uniref:hypothetical protein n=1 Tax=unclassified Mycolicibacterium TaxID=2636767 RepID=UPI0012DCAB0A|nr:MULTISPECIES: hypothetical protein [unclassified Mycolicibacterium]MUL47890.1 hypothetical protein [Mycolicibacterium sp. CBMA 360]MUL59262.1 hypothetical protein [Mycolicibacterium sp. CBMA 335]MUL70987.1 hypothetical protein [Mycolicibacterium sp. CBMA 311]MUL94630.1 hypothetical protein [Mycolicibacterium sp. CBMA 230]MUM09192.1 hypothetical protein [Mycolicibacterium sp. CBMA 213]